MFIFTYISSKITISQPINRDALKKLLHFLWFNSKKKYTHIHHICILFWFNRYKYCIVRHGHHAPSEHSRKYSKHSYEAMSAYVQLNVRYAKPNWIDPIQLRTLNTTPQNHISLMKCFPYGAPSIFDLYALPWIEALVCNRRQPYIYKSMLNSTSMESEVI